MPKLQVLGQGRAKCRLTGKQAARRADALCKCKRKGVAVARGRNSREQHNVRAEEAEDAQAARSHSRSSIEKEKGLVGSSSDQGWPSWRMPDYPPFFGLPLGYVVMLIWSFLVPALVIMFWRNPSLINIRIL